MENVHEFVFYGSMGFVESRIELTEQILLFYT